MKISISGICPNCNNNVIFRHDSGSNMLFDHFKGSTKKTIAESPFFDEIYEIFRDICSTDYQDKKNNFV